MRHAFSAILRATIAIAALLVVPSLPAQSVTTAVIQGSVQSVEGLDLDGT